MKESQLRALSIEFAVKIPQLVKELKAKKETILANQTARRRVFMQVQKGEFQHKIGLSAFIDLFCLT